MATLVEIDQIPLVEPIPAHFETAAQLLDKAVKAGCQDPQVAYMLALAREGIGAGLVGPPPEVSRSPQWPKWFLHLPLSEMDQAVGHAMPWQISMIAHHASQASASRSGNA